MEAAYYGYPIIYQDKVIAFATALGNNKFQISSAEADYINECGFDDVAIIYDADGCYISNGKNIKLVAENYEDMSLNRISLANAIGTNEQRMGVQSVVTSKVDEGELLGFVANDDQEETLAITPRISGYYSCTVDYLSQNPYDKLCWAACVGMVANYIHSELSLTAYSVATTYFDSTDETVFNNGVNRTVIAELLRNTYNCEYYQSLDYTPTDENIKRNISGGYPLVALFYVTDTGNGHTTVVDAIHTESHYIRVCDPGCGRIYVYRDYEHEDQSSYQEYAYTSPSTGNWLYMKEQVARFS